MVFVVLFVFAGFWLGGSCFRMGFSVIFWVVRLVG